MRYDAASHERWVTEIIDSFTPQRLRRLAAQGHVSRVPVIIAGMPRSGTTLVDQVLTSHSKVKGAGELDRLKFLLETAGQGGLQQALNALDETTIRHLADAYLTRLMRDVGPACRISDKSLANSLGLGMAAVLFPGAHFIHCRRHPLDTCLSIFFLDLNSSYAYGFDWENLAHYYACYRRLMAHWQTVLGERLLDLRYECLVEHPEQHARRLIAHCDLPWEPGCLAFYRNERSVRTSSVWQVRQPIYRRAVGRWHAYAEHLSPLKSALERLGVPSQDTI